MPAFASHASTRVRVPSDHGRPFGVRVRTPTCAHLALPSASGPSAPLAPTCAVSWAVLFPLPLSRCAGYPVPLGCSDAGGGSLRCCSSTSASVRRWTGSEAEWAWQPAHDRFVSENNKDGHFFVELLALGGSCRPPSTGRRARARCSRGRINLVCKISSRSCMICNIGLCDAHLPPPLP